MVTVRISSRIRSTMLIVSRMSEELVTRGEACSGVFITGPLYTVHSGEDGLGLDADHDLLAISHSGHVFFKVSDVSTVVTFPMQNHGEVAIHDRLADVQNIHILFCKCRGYGGDDASMIWARHGDNRDHEK